MNKVPFLLFIFMFQNSITLLPYKNNANRLEFNETITKIPALSLIDWVKTGKMNKKDALKIVAAKRKNNDKEFLMTIQQIETKRIDAGQRQDSSSMKNILPLLNNDQQTIEPKLFAYLLHMQHRIFCSHAKPAQAAASSAQG